MILAWQLGRAVGWLKRLTIAQEHLAAIEAERLERERLTYPSRRPIRHAVFDTADYMRPDAAEEQPL